MRLSPIYPEMQFIHQCTNARCILDGELIVLKNGKPEFEEILRRSTMTNKTRIELAASILPVTFTAFDILYYDDKQTTHLPLIERKELLDRAINETERFALSRFIPDDGISFYKLVEQNELEGIVAKRKESKYFMDKRTKDWIKIKSYKHEYFVVCGILYAKPHGMTSLVLGQYRDNQLIYKGHVSLGVSRSRYEAVIHLPEISSPFGYIPLGNENAIWVPPVLACEVKYMKRSSYDKMREAIFQGIRDNISPYNCKE
jgi:bifunctional non-homologous end joining protein LigD/DNA ligase-1